MSSPPTAIHNNGAGNQQAAFGNGDINTVSGGHQSIVHNHHTIVYHCHVTETKTEFKSQDKDLYREGLAKCPKQESSEQQRPRQSVEFWNHRDRFSEARASRRHRPGQEAGQEHQYVSSNTQTTSSSQPSRTTSSSVETLSQNLKLVSGSPTGPPHSPYASDLEIQNIGESQEKVTKQHDQTRLEEMGPDDEDKALQKLPYRAATMEHAFDSPVDPPKVLPDRTPMNTAPCDERCNQSNPTRKRLSTHSNGSSDSLDQNSSPGEATVGSGNAQAGQRQVLYQIPQPPGSQHPRGRSITRIASDSLALTLIPILSTTVEPRKRTRDRAAALFLVSRRHRGAATLSRQGSVVGVLAPTSPHAGPESFVGDSPAGDNAAGAYEKYEFKFTFCARMSLSKIEMSSITELARFRGRKER